MLDSQSIRKNKNNSVRTKKNNISILYNEAVINGKASLEQNKDKNELQLSLSQTSQLVNETNAISPKNEKVVITIVNKSLFE